MKNTILAVALLALSTVAASAAPLGYGTDGFGRPLPAKAVATDAKVRAYWSTHSIPDTSPAYMNNPVEISGRQGD
jgi:hypothetical protein